MPYQPDPARRSGLAVLADIEAARAAGIPWTDLIPADSGPADPGQHQAARAYLQFRQGLRESEDPVTAARGARILMAPPDAQLTERVWGLAPGETDFGDVAAALDDVAAQIHRPAELTQTAGGGRHEAPLPPQWPIADHG